MNIKPETVAQIESLLEGYGIKPSDPPSECNKPVSLVVPDDVLDRFTSPYQTPGAVISWSPPAPDWNPWISCNIDDGPMAFVSYILAFFNFIPNHSVKLRCFEIGLSDKLRKDKYYYE